MNSKHWFFVDINVLLVAMVCLCLVVGVQGGGFGEPCNGTGSDMDTCDPAAHLVCHAESSTCICDLTYIQRWDNGQWICKVDINCGKDDLCRYFNNSKCHWGQCMCADGYKMVSAIPKVCSPIIGTHCADAEACNVLGISKAECTGEPKKVCKCMYGYDGPACPQISDTKRCDNDSECSLLKHSYCRYGRCYCRETAIRVQNLFCKLKAGQPCNASQDICPKNAQCIGSPTKCTCADGYSQRDDRCKKGKAVTSIKVSVILIVVAFFSCFLH